MLSSKKLILQLNIRVIFIIIFVLYSVGCASIYKQPIHNLSLSSVDEKINLNVELVITDDYRNARWEYKRSGSTLIVPLGENLTHHSEKLVKSVFTNSTINTNSSSDYKITPKFISAKQSVGVSAFSKSKMSIIVEWTLKSTSGKLFWLETITGEGVNQSGNMFTIKKYQEERVQLALKDLFQKTQDTMITSRMLRTLTSED